MQIVAESGHRAACLAQSQWYRRRYGLGRHLGQPVLVVFEQQPPCPRVLLYDVEQGSALVRDQGVGGERPAQQSDRLLDLCQAPLGQSFLVERVAAQQVVSQGPRGPDAKLRAAL